MMKLSRFGAILLLFYFICLHGCGNEQEHSAYDYKEHLSFLEEEIPKLMLDLDRIGLQFDDNDVRKINSYEKLDLSLLHYKTCSLVRDGVYIDLLDKFKQYQLLKHNKELIFDSTKLAEKNFNCNNSKKIQLQHFKSGDFFYSVSYFTLKTAYQFQHSKIGLRLKKDKIKLGITKATNKEGFENLIRNIERHSPYNSTRVIELEGTILDLVKEEIRIP